MNTPDPNEAWTKEQSNNPGVSKEGWIWTSGKLKNMSLTEIEAWEETSTCILVLELYAAHVLYYR